MSSAEPSSQATDIPEDWFKQSFRVELPSEAGTPGNGDELARFKTTLQTTGKRNRSPDEGATSIGDTEEATTIRGSSQSDLGSGKMDESEDVPVSPTTSNKPDCGETANAKLPSLPLRKQRRTGSQ